MKEYARWLYHITFANRVRSIAQSGLGKRRMAPTWASYAFNTKGVTFFTEWDEVSHWWHRIFYAVSPDKPSERLVLLRVLRASLTNLSPDDVANAEFHNQSNFKTPDVIDSSLIEFWTGKAWKPLREWNGRSKNYDDDIDTDAVFPHVEDANVWKRPEQPVSYDVIVAPEPKTFGWAVYRYISFPSRDPNLIQVTSTPSRSAGHREAYQVAQYNNSNVWESLDITRQSPEFSFIKSFNRGAP